MSTRPVIPGSVAVIGHSGKVGKAIVQSLHKIKTPSIALLNRGQPVHEGHGPIWVCTTNDALDNVLKTCIPRTRYHDITLIQNGALQPFANSYGIALPGYQQTTTATAITQLLLYAAADGNGNLKCGGRSVVSGPWEQHCAATLAAAGVTCRIVPGSELAVLSVEKLLWASIAWLMSSALGGIQVGELVTNHAHKQDFLALANELLDLACTYMETSNILTGYSAPNSEQGHSQKIVQEQQQLCLSHPDGNISNCITSVGDTEVAAKVDEQRLADELSANREAVLQGLVDYTLSISQAVPSRTMALREFSWRNGYFLRLLNAARMNGTLPKNSLTLHESWLQRAGIDSDLARLQNDVNQ